MQFTPQMEKRRTLEEQTMIQSTKLEINNYLQHDRKTPQESSCKENPQ
jgi:hypothetical protein